jgi:hypothetical protein
VFVARATALVLMIFLCSATCTAWSQSPRLPYRLVSETRGPEGVSIAARTLAQHEALLQVQDGDSIRWEDIASRAFWPRCRKCAVIIAGAGLPSVRADIAVFAEGGPSRRGEGCRAITLKVSGEAMGGSNGEFAGDSNPKHGDAEGVTLSGEGRALECEGESFPRAGAIALARRVMPALWARREGWIEERVSSAWAALP